MTDTFNSITQYDKQFDSMFQNINKKGYACSYFSLITAWKFLANYNMTQEEHNDTVVQSLMLTSIFDTCCGITFEDLLTNYSDINQLNINATTVDLINENVISFVHMFPKIESELKYATIILKNEKYIVVLVDKNEYKLRDCHEKTQYNFKTFDDLVIHLINVYQFTQKIDIEGIDYSEYSSIEFLTINAKFTSELINMLSLQPQKKQLFDPNGDVFDIPDNYTLTKADINYLEMLNEQFNERDEKIQEVNNIQNESHETINDDALINENSNVSDLVNFD